MNPWEQGMMEANSKVMFCEKCRVKCWHIEENNGWECTECKDRISPEKLDGLADVAAEISVALRETVYALHKLVNLIQEMRGLPPLELKDGSDKLDS